MKKANQQMQWGDSRITIEGPYDGDLQLILIVSPRMYLGSSRYVADKFSHD